LLLESILVFKSFFFKIDGIHYQIFDAILAISLQWYPEEAIQLSIAAFIDNVA
jgi:hypothetical protein